MAGVDRFQDLRVWQEARTLTLFVYRVTKSFPRYEVFGLTSQIRRAVVSIEGNIAEGTGRGSKELIQFLIIARGSLEEVKCYVSLARDLEYLDESQCSQGETLAGNIGRMLHGLISSLRRRTSK